MKRDEVYRERLKNLRKKLDSQNVDAILINNLTNVRYLSGFTGSNGQILISNENAYFLTDSRYTQQAKEEVCCYEVIKPLRSWADTIKRALRDKDVRRLGIETDNLTVKQLKVLKKRLDFVEIIETEGIVEALRVVKNPLEIEKLQKAYEIAENAFKEIIDYIKPGVRERDIAIELEYRIKKNSDGVPFDIIVASGQRSSLPHGKATNKILLENEFVIFDWGAIYEGYCSDITRMVYIGKPSSEEKEMFNILLAAQRLALEEIRPKIKITSLDKKVRNFLKEKEIAKFFVHNLGHGIGMNVHEEPRVGPNNKKILKERMTFTVEPGIYFPSRYGIRIEDGVFLTEDGYRLLSKGLSKDLLLI
jgi:Xaa-Pro aminopeptidase